jgi:hypothetical protein
MKYAFIERHRRVWPISVQCRVLEVSIAGYHEHFTRLSSAAQRRHLSDDALLVHIKWTSPAFVDINQLPVRSCSNADGLSWSR